MVLLECRRDLLQNRIIDEGAQSGQRCRIICDNQVARIEQRPEFPARHVSHPSVGVDDDAFGRPSRNTTSIALDDVERDDKATGSRDRRSTTGTAVTGRAGSKLWRMASRGRSGSGTRSLTRSGRRSSVWLLRSRTCRRGSSPSTSRTRTAALCPRPAFTGS